jgi:methyltransferase OMS1
MRGLTQIKYPNVVQCSSPSSSRVTRRHTLLLQLAGLVTGCRDAHAEDKKIMELYDDAAKRYDSLDGGAAASAFGFDGMRAKLLAQAKGKTLETGVGTGLNLPYYDFKSLGVTELTGVDISSGMLREARLRANSLQGSSVDLIQADVTSLPLDDGSFDSVVDTFSLCVFSQPLLALEEMRRVVKSDGRVLLLAHTRSDNPLIAGYQELTAEAVRRTARGCDWNQDVPTLVKAAGLEIMRMERALAGTVISIEARPARH